MTATERAARDRMARVMGWQHLVKYAGMSEEWMDRVLGALARAALEDAASETPDVMDAEYCEAIVRRDWAGYEHDEPCNNPAVGRERDPEAATGWFPVCTWHRAPEVTR